MDHRRQIQTPSPWSTLPSPHLDKLTPMVGSMIARVAAMSGLRRRSMRARAGGGRVSIASTGIEIDLGLMGRVRVRI